MAERSIYPIRYFHFTCQGCQAQWSLYVDPPVTNAEEFKAYMAAGKMGPCPNNCGSKLCNVMFRVKGDD